MSNRFCPNTMKDSSDALADDQIAGLERMLSELCDTPLEEELRGPSIYTGAGGGVLLFLHLYQCRGHAEYLSRACELFAAMERRYDRRPSSRVTFLNGPPGRFALGAVLAHMSHDTDKRRQCITALLKFKSALHQDDVDDEILYGRAGYLYALLFVKSLLPDEIDIDDAASPVIEELIARGKQQSSGDFPLLFAWHRKFYLGAAHGISGILHLLTHFRHLGAVPDDLLQAAIDSMMGLQFPSGNFPSSLKDSNLDRKGLYRSSCPPSSNDRLVQWCHGACGFVYLFLRAHEIYGDAKYSDCALACGEVLWERGLLLKSPGLCHGIGGNGMPFIALHRATGDHKWMQRARQFAVFATSPSFEVQDRADEPLSLYQGEAGLAWLVASILHPESAYFPGLEAPGSLVGGTEVQLSTESA